MPSISDIKKLYPEAKNLSDDQIMSVFNEYVMDNVKSVYPEAKGLSQDEVFGVIGNQHRIVKNAGVAGRVKDFGLDVAKGVIGAGESVVGLADLVTGNAAGNFLRDSIGYDPKTSKQMLDSWQSDERQQESRAVQDTKGFVNTLGALVDNPAVAVGAVGESAPLMLGTAGAVRAAATQMLSKAGLVAGTEEAAKFLARPEVASRLALIGSTAEGAMTAGNIQETARQEGRNWSDSAGYAAAGGLGTAAIGRLASKILPDADVLAGTAGLGAKAGAKEGMLSSAKAIGKGIVQEGVLEEMPQSAQEQVASNLALGKPWDEGVSEAAAMGLATGGLMGGGMTAANRFAPAVKTDPIQDFADAVEGTNFNPDATARDAMLDQVQSIDPRLTRIAHAEQTKAAAQQAIATAPTVDAAVDAFNVATAAGSASMVDQSQLLNDVNEATNASIAAPLAEETTQANDAQVGAEQAAAPLLTVPAQPTTTKPLEQTPVAMPIPKEIADRMSAKTDAELKVTAAAHVDPVVQEAAKQEQAKRAKPIYQWTEDELSDRLQRADSGESPLSQESRTKIESELAKRVPATPKVKRETKLSIGSHPTNAEPITVNNGVVYVGKYPAMDYETEDDITVKDGATDEDIVSALRAGGVIGRNKVFGLVKSEKPAAPKKDRKAVYPESDSALVAIAKLGGMDTQQLLTNGFDQKDISVLSRGKTIGKRAMQTGGKIPKNAGQIGKGSMRAKQVGFNMPIHRNGGMSFDGMREALVQYGYLPEDASVNDAIELLRRELRGEPVYTASAVQAQAEAAEADRQAMMEAEQEANEASGYDELQGTAEERAADALIEELYGEEVAALARGMRVAGLTEEEINAEIKAFNQRTGAQDGAGQSQERSGEGRAEESGTDAEVFGGKETGDPFGLGATESADPFGLEGQTDEEAAAEYKQQQAPEGISKEQIDREVDGFGLHQESQPKPQGVQGGMFTADGRVSSDAAQAESAKDVRTIAEGTTEREIELRRLSHDIEQPGDVELGNGKFVTLAQAKAAAQSAIDDGVLRPTAPFQYHNILDIAPRDWNRMVAEMTAVNTENVAKSEVTKPATKIADFGEKIGGAKKDVWTSHKDKLDDAAKLDIKVEPLSKSWPEPNYQSLIDAGADPFVVAFMRASRDAIPRKPTAKWKLKSWAGSVELLRDTSAKLLSGEIDANRAKELLQKAGDVSSNMRKIAGRIELYQLVGHRQSLDGVSLEFHHYTLYKGQENVSIWSIEKEAKATAFSNWPAEIVTGKTKAEVLDKFKEMYDKIDLNKKADRTVSFDLYSQGNKFYVGKKMGRNITQLAGPFDTVKEARAYRTDNQEELIARLEKAKEIPAVRRDTNNPRVGEDMRGGQDVTPELFAETFGFKGVEFGNWVEQKKRQKDLNDSFDALMDMAAIIGVPPKALSLNGELGLAFGARGSGGVDPAAAHYEPGKVVINLTKKEGAGSLGHEWWHALDNYFSRLRGKGGEFTTQALDVSLADRESKFIANTPVRKEMIEAFGAVMRAIRMTALKARSSKLDAKRSKEYWTGKEEMSARAFESYLISKLQDQNASNDYLANIVDQDTWKAAESLGFELDDSYPYPTAGEMPLIREAFDRFFDTVQTKETEQGVAMYSKGATTSTPLPQQTAERLIASELGSTTLAKALADSGIVSFVNRGSQFQGATFENGNIVLNLDALTEQNFSGVFKHEGFHSTVRELVGEETWNQLMSQLEQNLKAAKGNEWVTRANAAIPADTKASDRTEELAAYSIEQATNGEKVPNFIKRWVDSLLSAIRTALIRGMGGERAKLWAMKNLKPQDLANLAVAGLKAKAGKVAATSNTPAGLAGARLSKTQERTMRAVKSGSSEPVQYGEAGGKISIEDFNAFVNSFKENKPVDTYGYKQKINDLIDEIESDWHNGNSDEYSRMYWPKRIYADLRDENEAEYFDEDGDLTDAGSRRYNDMERDLSTKIAKEEAGEPERNPVFLNKAGDMAEVVHAYLEKLGLSPSAIGGSGKSDSKYFSITINGEMKKVRVSDHQLPVEYQDANGSADYEISIYEVGDEMRRDGRMESVGISEEEAASRAVDAINEMLQDNAAKALYSSAFGPESQHRTPLGDVTEIEVDGVERPALNSNGKPIHWSREGVENFWRWFAGSKVVDAQGRPLVVYHGTKSTFSEFDIRKAGQGDEGLAGKGFYFTYNADEASRYAEVETYGAGESPQVIPAYISVNDPLMIVGGSLPDGRKVMDVHKQYGAGINAKGGAAIKKIAEDGGHDGVMWVRTDGGVGHVVSFSPTQIKSATGNTGDFDGSNPDIRYSTDRDSMQRMADKDTVAGTQAPTSAGDGSMGSAAIPEGHVRLYSGSHEKITEIRDDGMFGGIFASDDFDVAESHGFGKDRVTHFMDVPEDAIAENSDLDTDETENILRRELGEFSEEEYDGVFRAIVKDKGLWDSDLSEDRILDIFGGSDIGEADWNAQRVRGVLAKELGFQAVEMRDEHGTSYLVLPGVQVRQVQNEQIASDGSDADIRYSKASSAQPAPLPEETKARAVQRNSFSLPEWTKTDTVQERIQDRYNRIRDVVKAIRSQGLVSDLNNFDMGEDRFHGVAMAKIEAIEEDVLSLLKAAKAADITLEEATMYAYAEHAPERNKAMQAINQNVKTGSGMSDQEAADIITKAKQEGKDAALSQIADNMRAIASRTLKAQLDAGLIEQSEYDNYTNKYQKWVPLRGFETIDEQGRTFRGTGKGFNIRGKENLRALGRDSKAGQILENIVMDAERTAIRSTKNVEVNHRFLRFVLDNPDPTLWEIDATKTKQALKNGRVSLDSLIDKGDNTIGVKVNGQVVYVKIHDQKLFEQLANMWDDSEFGAIPYLGEIQRYLAKSYTAWSPEFALFTNPVRDITAALVSITGREGAAMTARFAKNYAAALKAAYQSEVLGKKVPIYAEYEAMGGKTGFWNVSTLQSKKEEIESLIKDMENLKLRNAWRTPLKLAKALEKIVSHHAGALENATRLASYMAMKEAGKSKEEASAFAKNLNVNFNRRGTWTSGLGSIFLFFNPAVQGTHNMYQTLVNGKHNKQAMALMGMGVAGMFMLALMNAGAGEDDDGIAWWDKISDFEKQTNVIIVLPSYMKDIGEQIKDSTGRYIKFPMPYGWNVPFYSGSVAADVMRNTDDPATGLSAGKGSLLLGQAAVKSFNPVGIPQAVAPFWQHYTNTGPFGGRLYPENEWNKNKPGSEKYSAAMQGSPWQEWAEFVNEATGGNKYQAGVVSLPPAVWRNYMRSFIGGPMSFATATSDSITEGDITKAPFIRKAYGEVDFNEDAGKYYDLAKKAEAVFDAAKAAEKAGDVDLAKNIRESDKVMYKLGQATDVYNKRLGETYKKEATLKKRSDMTEKERELALQMNEYRRSNIQEQYLKQWRVEVNGLR